MRLKDLGREHVGVCVSGGLDSKTVTRKLVELGVKTTCFTADLAQPDEADIRGVVQKMAPCGARTVAVDLKDDMAQACFDVIRAQAMYDGGYWNSTGIARAVTVRGLLPALRKAGCTTLVHGATGRGNDQVRFERYTNVLDPRMKVFAPWRDPELLQEFPGRKQMIAFLGRAGIPVKKIGKKRYSTDANLAGISYEAEDLESLETPSTIVDPQMGVWPKDAPNKPEAVSITFRKGYAIKLNGRAMKPLDLMKEANRRSGRNGIGIKNALENRIIGTKSRGVYEAPGMELLAYGLRQIYHATLNRSATELFATLSGIISRSIYCGTYFDPATRAAQRALDVLTESASGTIHIQMYKGNLVFLKLEDCAGSLYREADASMEASEGLNPVSSQGYLEVQSVEAKALAFAGQIKVR